MYEDDYNWGVGCCHWKIKEIYGGFGRQLNAWGCYLIVICFLLMLYGKYTIVEKFRVNLVDKVNVERWGLFLMLVKSWNKK